MKKLSELMLEGYAMVGQQCMGSFYDGCSSRNPLAVCGEGAAYLAATGSAVRPTRAVRNDLERFKERVGLAVSILNDEGMSIPDIAGIAAAEGL